MNHIQKRRSVYGFDYWSCGRVGHHHKVIETAVRCAERHAKNEPEEVMPMTEIPPNCKTTMLCMPSGHVQMMANKEHMCFSLVSDCYAALIEAADACYLSDYESHILRREELFLLNWSLMVNVRERTKEFIWLDDVGADFVIAAPEGNA